MKMILLCLLMTTAIFADVRATAERAGQAGAEASRDVYYRGVALFGGQEKDFRSEVDRLINVDKGKLERELIDLRESQREAEEARDDFAAVVSAREEFNKELNDTVSKVGDATRLTTFARRVRDAAKLYRENFDQMLSLDGLSAEDRSKIEQSKNAADALYKQLNSSSERRKVTVGDVDRLQNELKGLVESGNAVDSSWQEIVEQRKRDLETAVETESKKVNNLNSRMQKPDQAILNERLADFNRTVGEAFTSGKITDLEAKMALQNLERWAERWQVQLDDLKDGLRSNEDFANSMAATPMGVYINNQIAKSMSKVCEYVRSPNLCQEPDGIIDSFFRFLNGSPRAPQQAVPAVGEQTSDANSSI